MAAVRASERMRHKTGNSTQPVCIPQNRAGDNTHLCKVSADFEALVVILIDRANFMRLSTKLATVIVFASIVHVTAVLT